MTNFAELALVSHGEVYHPWMRDSWEERVRRAEELSGENDAAAPLLAFYARLLQIQSEMYRGFALHRPSGNIQSDAAQVASAAAGLIREVADCGPAKLANEAKKLLERGRSAVEGVVLEYWQHRSDRDFFGKAIVQPYAQWLAGNGSGPETEPHASRRCPRCGGAPQLSILDTSGGTAMDRASRQLLCATCLTPWSFPRVVCATCGEEDERKVSYFQAPPFDHVRVDACETCRHYIKSIDVSRLGLAVPLVDEVVAAPLDLWARERGYDKIELNLLGL